jgi:acetylornithine deacetylase
MKPTQVTSAPCGVNQLPPWTEIKGDIRLTPFYDVDRCVEKMRDYVKKLNDGNLRLCEKGVSNSSVPVSFL